MNEARNNLLATKMVSSIAIIGNGVMGQGVSQVFARAGKHVRLIGRNPGSLARAMEAIESSLIAFVSRNMMTSTQAASALMRISTSTDYNDATGADLVIEAVSAERNVRRRIFEKLDTISSPRIVIASTSDQPISENVDRMKHPERAVAMHFSNPAQIVPIVEVCGGPLTSPEVVTWTCEILKAVGQTPIVMNKEVDGFLINRLQFAVLREALSMWANGIASAEDIDAAFKMGLATRYSVAGPLESADLGGLDVTHMFSEFLLPGLENGKALPEALTELVRNGNFGQKTGKGIYNWDQRDGDALRADRDNRLFQDMSENHR